MAHITFEEASELERLSLEMRLLIQRVIRQSDLRLGLREWPFDLDTMSDPFSSPIPEF
jgi:hypothetical protein